jgi:hypothetical protein
MTNCQRLLSMHKKAAAPMGNAGARVKKPAPAAPAQPAMPGVGPSAATPGAPGAKPMPVANPVMPKTAPIQPGMAAGGKAAAHKQAGEAAPAGAANKATAPVVPINQGGGAGMPKPSLWSQLFSPSARNVASTVNRVNTTAQQALPVTAVTPQLKAKQQARQNPWSAEEAQQVALSDASMQNAETLAGQ